MNSTGLQIDDLNTTQPRGICPHCNHGVGFRRVDRRMVFPELIPQRNASGMDFSAVGSSPTPERKRVWRKVEEYVLECQLCEKTCVFFAHWGPDVPSVTEALQSDQRMGDIKLKVTRLQLIYPSQQNRALHEAAPPKMREMFHEGARCESAGALRAAAAMYRAAVEELCADKQAAGGKLFEKIEGLTSRGVSPEIVADLHEARTLGNWSLHDGLSFSAEEVADVALLIEEAVKVVYVQPEERAALRAARKKRRDQHRAKQES
ncbi:DUF4145 domain-containing protein [Streptomyces microflavus]|uniref:DUF4145 domain-containing protein n=1 Tax=Streptomyces microflavus TaxID=1919 RepID=UPI00364B7857